VIVNIAPPQERGDRRRSLPQPRKDIFGVRRKYSRARRLRVYGDTLGAWNRLWPVNASGHGARSLKGFDEGQSDGYEEERRCQTFWMTP
jgi:hypothetical protein